MTYKVIREIPFIGDRIMVINGYDIYIPQTHQLPITGELQDFPIWIKTPRSYRVILFTCDVADLQTEIAEYIDSPYSGLPVRG